MASLIFNGGLFRAVTGAIDFDTDSFRVMLATAAYIENKATHVFRAAVTNEIVGTGYTAGGNTPIVTVTQDDTNNRIDVSLGGTTWPGSTISARKAVYYKAVGLATTDPLVAVNDFGADVATTAGTFTLAASILRISNP